jgi:hypothetical protein
MMSGHFEWRTVTLTHRAGTIVSLRHTGSDQRDRCRRSPLGGKPDDTSKLVLLANREKAMSNHFTGLSLGPPLGDQRLDLCDLYAFQSPADKNRTVIILNANPNADALHPDAIYRINIDNDGDLTDMAFSYVFSEAA